MLILKQKILGGFFGSVIIKVRDVVEIILIAIKHPEWVGTIANDQIALRLVTQLTQSGLTFVDIGAHIGSVTSRVLNMDSSVTVVAIEPSPEKLDHLVYTFPEALVHGCALGEMEGDVSFFINTKNPAYSALGMPNDIDITIIREVTVKMLTLDQVLLPSSNIDVIKIDVEGAELGVLKGGIATLKKYRPIVLFESSIGDINGIGYTLEAMWEFLCDNEYQIVIPIRLAHADDGLSKEGFFESHLYPRRTTNYFAVPKERRDEFRVRARKILELQLD